MPERDNASLASVALLFALSFGSTLVPPPFGAPKLAFFAAIALYAVVVLAVPSLRASVKEWLVRGSLGRRALIEAALVSTLSTTALVIYAKTVHPDTSDLAAQLPLGWSRGALGALAVAIATLNALTEEIAYRGALMHALDREFSPGVLSNALQALAFAAPHYGRGYPRGAVGVALCVVYGLLLGALRRRARGLSAPILAHITADLTIFAIVSRAAPG